MNGRQPSAGPVRVAVVGAGWWSSIGHLPALADCAGAEIVALCDPNTERAAAVAKRFDIDLVVNSVEALIDAKVADAVIVATPHVTHHPIVFACLTAGLHVLVEKPMTISSVDAFELVELAERNGLHLSVGYTYQHSDTAVAVRQAVQSDIGELVQVVVEFASNTANLFARAEQADESGADEPHPSTYSAPNGGGQANTQLTHAMGMVCWATGREIRDVVAFTDDRGLTVDVDDVAAFRFVGGGTGVAATTGTVTGSQPVRHHVRYLGTRGVLDQDLLTGDVQLSNDHGFRSFTSAPDGDSYRRFRPAQAFVEVIAGTAIEQSPARPAAATVAFLEAMLASAASGRRVEVSPLPPRASTN